MGQLQQKLPTPTTAAITNGSRTKPTTTTTTAPPQASYYYTKCGKPRKVCCGRKAGRKCKKWCPGPDPAMVSPHSAIPGDADIAQGLHCLNLDEKSDPMPVPTQSHAQTSTARPSFGADRPPSYHTINPPTYTTPALHRSTTFASRFLDTKIPTDPGNDVQDTALPVFAASQHEGAAPPFTPADVATRLEADTMPCLAPHGGVSSNPTPPSVTRRAFSASSSSSGDSSTSSSYLDHAILTPLSESSTGPASPCPVNAQARQGHEPLVPWYAMQESKCARKAVKWHRKRCVQRDAGCWCGRVVEI